MEPETSEVNLNRASSRPFGLIAVFGTRGSKLHRDRVKKGQAWVAVLQHSRKAKWSESNTNEDHCRKWPGKKLRDCYVTERRKR